MSATCTVHSVQIITLMLLVATAVAVIVKWVRIPYSIALVIAGLLIGSVYAFPARVLTPELVSFIFLPPLLFESGWNIHFDKLKRNWLPITVLATFGVGLSIAVMAFCLHSFATISLGAAFLVATMLSATDPISVVATFRKMGISKRLTTILEGESLFNDGTAMVAFTLALTAVSASTEASWPTISLRFLVMVIGGALVGLACGVAAAKITDLFDDHLLEIMLTTTVAYGSFLLADALKLSSIIAVATSAIVLANLRGKCPQRSRFAVNSFWEYVTYVVNSLVFLLIGMQVHVSALTRSTSLMLAGIFALLVSRMVVIYVVCPLVSRSTAPIPFSWRHVLWWGGLRGALSMVMAMSLPQGIPMREEMIVLTFGLVIFTLLVPGLTIETLVRALRIDQRKSNQSNRTAVRQNFETERKQLIQALANG